MFIENANFSLEKPSRPSSSYSDSTTEKTTFTNLQRTNFHGRQTDFSSCSSHSQTINLGHQVPNSKPLKVDIDEKRFNLETAIPSEADVVEYTPIPDSIAELIEE